MAPRRMGLGRRGAACLAALALFGCSARAPAPSRAPQRAARPPAPKPVAAPEPEPTVEPEICPYEDYYEEQSFFVSLEPNESTQGSRFYGRDEGACGDRTLVLATDGRGATLTATHAGKSVVVFRDTTDFVMLEGCVDLTGDGSPELVVRRPDDSGKLGSTEVIALEATPRSLFKIPFDLELRKTKGGPYPYELVNDEGFVMTHAVLPVVFAYRNGRFERIGASNREYWEKRRELVKKTLDCHAKTPGAMPRTFVNVWFSQSLYVGDWDEKKQAYDIDPTQQLELDLARKAYAKTLDGQAAFPVVPTSVWLASKGAPADIATALAELSKLPPLPVTTEVEEEPPSDDANAPPPPPPGFRFLGRPKDRGALVEHCGKYTVEQVGDDEIHTHVRLRNAEGRYVGRIMPAVSIGHAEAEWCFDLTGDGVPELLVSESSGGAHCCHTFRVISLGATPELLLDYQAGNAWLEGPENLDQTRAYELVGRDDFLTNDASASSYAATYFVPVVWVYEKGKYVRRTRRFKALLEKERSELAAEYHEESPNGFTSDPSGWMALSLLLGDWEKVKGRLPIEPSGRAWFDPEGTLARIQRDIER